MSSIYSDDASASVQPSLSGSLGNYSEVLCTKVLSDKHMHALSAIATNPRDITCSGPVRLKPEIGRMPNA